MGGLFKKKKDPRSVVSILRDTFGFFVGWNI